MAAGKKSTEIGEPFDVRTSPHAPEKLPSELRKLWTLCAEHEVPWEYDIRELNSHGGSSKYRERAKVDHNVLNTTLDSAMAALKHEGCDRLFLGGRDVWAFAVMCERRRIPYMYVPELSRYVSARPEVRPFLEARGFRGDRELFLDTGYAGSIPRNLAAHFPGTKFKFRLMSQTEQFVHKVKEAQLVDCDPSEGKNRKLDVKKERWKRFPNQLFPNRKTARDEAMFQEYVAKYQKSGTFSEAMKSAPVGHAPSVFKEWLHKPGIWRYDDVKNRMLCMTDGKEAVGVSLNDIKMAPGFHEWWKSLPKGPIWVPPNHTMGEIVQYLSDKRTIQRTALLTSQLWRGIPHWKSMTVEKPAPGANIYMGKMGDPVLNTMGIENLTVNTGNILTYSSANSSTTNISIQGLMANGFYVQADKTDANGLPVLEVTKAQLHLFKDFPNKKIADALKQAAKVEEPSQMELLSDMWMAAEKNTAMLKVKMAKTGTGCTCGPEEVCSECSQKVPGDAMMDEHTFNALFPQTVEFV